MPLRTAKRSTPFIIGDSIAGATLTADFSDNAVYFPAEMYKGMKIYVNYTPAQNARNCIIQVEFGPEEGDFYIDTIVRNSSDGDSDILSWTGTIAGTTASTDYKRVYRVPVDSSYIRVSVKEDGVTGFGTITIKGEFKI